MPRLPLGSGNRDQIRLPVESVSTPIPARILPRPSPVRQVLEWRQQQGPLAKRAAGVATAEEASTALCSSGVFCCSFAYSPAACSDCSRNSVTCLATAERRSLSQYGASAVAAFRSCAYSRLRYSHRGIRQAPRASISLTESRGNVTALQPYSASFLVADTSPPHSTDTPLRALFVAFLYDQMRSAEALSAQVEPPPETRCSRPKTNSGESFEHHIN